MITKKLWVCDECGQEIICEVTPSPLKWKDGHICKDFIEAED
jgi:hypothetical protein